MSNRRRTTPTRCGWAKSDLSIAYHDTEWGVPVHDDRLLFEFLILEGAQAGLSWETILKKRLAYRVAFDQFEIQKVASYGARNVEQLLQNPGIIRNRLKVMTAIENARAALAVQSEVGSLDRYLWSFVNGRSRINHWRTLQEVPATTPEAKAMSKGLIRRGFRFVGPTICYAFMQAVGMVNDHVGDCFRHAEIRRLTS
jgi:DNA-3-methyladenine glycosylase I